jgi:hypothetical protein
LDGLKLAFDAAGWSKFQGVEVFENGIKAAFVV